MRSVIIGVAALIIVIGGVLLLYKGKTPSYKSSNTNTTAGSYGASKTSTGTSNQSTTGSSSAIGATESFTVTANDDSSTPETITAKKGDTVKLTLVVSKQGTYHGGLEFKSTDPAVDSGSIAEGDQKTISFTATKSFKFTPYWYQSNIQKDYFVAVNVQ